MQWIIYNFIWEAEDLKLFLVIFLSVKIKAENWNQIKFKTRLSNTLKFNLNEFLNLKKEMYYSIQRLEYLDTLWDF